MASRLADTVAAVREESAGSVAIPASAGHESLNEDVLSRAEQREQPLFAGHVKVYPKKVTGLVRRIKWVLLAGLLAVYYLVPWLRWDRGPGAPDQAVLIDMPGRRAYFFWIEIWPQEVYFLTGILILGALALFLATSLAGRVWCGYACPQTVWTDLFMWVERQIEGDRNARIKLDQGPWTMTKAGLKIAKHGAWLFIALLTGGAWVMYFADAPTVVTEFFTGQASLTVYFFVGLFTATTYLLAGMAREQVCTYMCPWPRIQGGLIDEDSLLVTYQSWRGEPRGKHKRGQSWDGRGDCIDCKQCVAVCPTGIDIRDGFQLECIGCGLCVDACNTVMDKVGRPRQLITFDTERNQQLRSAGLPPVYRLIRPRTILYVVLILGVAGLMMATLVGRSSVEVNVLHDRNPLFVTLSDGGIRNGYTVKVLNKRRETRDFALTLTGVEDAGLRVPEGTVGPGVDPVLTAEPDSVATYQVFVTMPAEALSDGTRAFDFVLTDTETGETARHESIFRGPAR
ncbi:MAG: cytochrome c oxidase accessory protein CcoG [Inquilinaceae bacterium]